MEIKHREYIVCEKEEEEQINEALNSLYALVEELDYYKYNSEILEDALNTISEFIDIINTDTKIKTIDGLDLD